MVNWTDDVLMTMIETYSEYINEVSSENLSMSTVYRRMAAALTKKKYKISRLAVKKKWLNMMNSYRRIKKRAQGGRVAKTSWDYFQVS